MAVIGFSLDSAFPSSGWIPPRNVKNPILKSPPFPFSFSSKEHTVRKYPHLQISSDRLFPLEDVSGSFTHLRLSGIPPSQRCSPVLFTKSHDFAPDTAYIKIL